MLGDVDRQGHVRIEGGEGDDAIEGSFDGTHVGTDVLGDELQDFVRDENVRRGGL